MPRSPALTTSYASSRTDESPVVIARHEAITQLKRKQIAAPPSSCLDFNNIPAAVARNDEHVVIASEIPNRRCETL